MADHVSRLLVYDREMHLDLVSSTISIGDTFEAIRGNGPREGDHMGTATVTGFDSKQQPILDVRFGGNNRAQRRGRAPRRG